jgi:hypothetical protein
VAEGTRLLKGAIDMHFHMDAPGPNAQSAQHDITDVRLARSRGLRAIVIKNHNEPTATLAYHLRKEMADTGFDIFGGIVMNLPTGGMNPAAVEFMATAIKGAPGKIVWMPAGNAEIEFIHPDPYVAPPSWPYRPFVAVSSNGELLPETKAVIALVAKHDLILASGHIAPEEALLVFREGINEGVKHMIATHAMELAGKMTVDQIEEAVNLGAIIEFDFRHVLDKGSQQADVIRKIGAEHCLISDFWTHDAPPREYAGPEDMGLFVEAMHAHGFSDHDLDVMFKENPAKLLELSSQ